MTDNRVRYFRVPTPIGDVWVWPLRDGEVLVTGVTGNGSGSGHLFEGGKAERLYVTIRGVQYDPTTWMERDANGEWQPAHRFTLARQGDNWKRGTSAYAEARAKTAIYGAVGAWLKSEAAAPLRSAMAAAETAEALSAVAQLQRETSEIRVMLTDKTAALQTAQRRLAVSRGEIAECGCDLLAYPAGYVCEHGRAKS